MIAVRLSIGYSGEYSQPESQNQTYSLHNQIQFVQTNFAMNGPFVN
jgi:hypothetical protein